MCECSVKKKLQQLQQKEQKRIWQVCFSRILGLNTVDRHIFLGRGLGGDVGLFSLFTGGPGRKMPIRRYVGIPSSISSLEHLHFPFASICKPSCLGMRREAANELPESSLQKRKDPCT